MGTGSRDEDGSRVVGVGSMLDGVGVVEVLMCEVVEVEEQLWKTKSTE